MLTWGPFTDQQVSTWCFVPVFLGVKWKPVELGPFRANSQCALCLLKQWDWTPRYSQPFPKG